MSTSRAYTIACAASLPLVAGGALIGGGSALAGATVVAGLAAIVSLALGELVARRFVLAAARGRDALAVPAFAARQLAALPAAAALMAWVGPTAVALGFATLVLGAGLHAAVQVLHAADAAALTPDPLPRHA